MPDSGIPLSSEWRGIACKWHPNPFTSEAQPDSGMLRQKRAIHRTPWEVHERFVPDFPATGGHTFHLRLGCVSAIRAVTPARIGPVCLSARRHVETETEVREVRVDTRTREVESEITTRITRAGHRQEWKFWRQEVLSGLKNTFQGSWREEDDPAADTDEFAQDLAGSWRSCTAGWSSAAGFGTALCAR